MNGFVTHWVIGSEGKFHLDPFSGIMTLTGSLAGSDTKDTYHMTIYARDHGDEPKVANISVILEVSRTNLHTPEFVDFVYDLSILENMIPTNPLLEINVTDFDEGVAGIVTLTLSDVSPQPFKIDTDGKLRLMEELDYETQPFYNLQVVATDGASDAKTATNMIRVTVVDVNDNKPYFMPLPSRVHLPVQSGSSQLVVQVIALDMDGDLLGNNQIGYQLLLGFDICTIDSTSGEIFTKPSAQPGTYNLRIQAYDHGSPSLTNTTTIQLTLLDDIARAEYPIFTQQSYSVSYNESWRPPRSVVQVQTRFGDNSNDYSVLYKLIGGNEGQEFIIDSSSVCTKLQTA
jgi:hypothetical protein